jgi:hypothetical protein
MSEALYNEIRKRLQHFCDKCALEVALLPINIIIEEEKINVNRRRSNGIRAFDDVLLLWYHKNANVLVKPLSLLRVQLCEKERIGANCLIPSFSYAPIVSVSLLRWVSAL